MYPNLKPFVELFIEQEKLPQDYFTTVEKWFLPLLDELLVLISRHEGTYVIGISGCQGSGKSTLASLLVMLLNKTLGLRCINLSIDDFYLTHEERLGLAKTINPLLATRGVPGTHDVKLAINTITALTQAGTIAVPRFDKATDDRVPESQWPQFQGPVDVIVLEGWCLAIENQEEELLHEPVNDLEAREDSTGVWRRYVNDAIKNQYRSLYDMVDYLVMLKAPDFNKVYEWRQTQEKKLADAVNDSTQKKRIMSSEELRRFIQHYERITRHGLETLPGKADVVFQLTESQTIDKRI